MSIQIEQFNPKLENFEVREIKPKGNMRATSLIAFSQIVESLGDRQMQVLKCIKEIGQPCSNLQISKYLHLPINSITPRVLELRKKGIVMMDRVGDCEFTGRKVIYWKIKNWIKEVMI